MSVLPNHISAVLRALRFQDSDPKSLESLSEAEWKKLLSSWDVVCLMIPLRRLHGPALPESVRSHIDKNIEDNTERFRRILETYAEVAEALRDANVEHVVLKGFAQWPDYCEHPRFRFQSDIDLYCPPESIKSAADALRTLGYHPDSGVNCKLADHVPTMIRRTDWQWRENFYDPDMPVSIELHFCFWNTKAMRLKAPGVEDFWSRRVAGHVDTLSFPNLAPQDKLGYSSLHVLRDVLQGGPVTGRVYELARFLHVNAENNNFWENWRDAHNEQLRRFEAISFRLASQWFGCRLADDCSSETRSLPAPIERWLRDFGEVPLHALSRKNKDSVWLHLNLLQSKVEKTTVLVRRLFPPRLPDTSRAKASGIRKPGNSLLSSVVRPLRYGAFFASRLVHHASLVPLTIRNGIRLWWSSREIAKGFWTFLATAFFFEIGLYVFFFLYNLYLLDAGFKENFLGYVASAASIGSIAGSLLGGLAVQRLGLRRCIHICLTLASLMSAMRTLFSSPPVLLVFAFLAGASTTLWAVSLSPAIAQLTNERSRPFAFSLVFSSGVGVGIFGGQLGGHLPSWISSGFHVASPASAKQIALLIACGVVALGNWPARHLNFEKASIPSSKLPGRSVFLMRFLPAIALWSLVAGAVVPFFNVYFSQQLHMPIAQIGSIFSASQILQVLAMLAAPLIFRRFGLITGIMYTQFATAFALACVAISQSGSAGAASFLIFSSFLWMSEPGLFSLLMDRVSAPKQGPASALNFLVTSSSQAVAAAIAGTAFLRFGYPSVIGAVAGIAVLSALLFGWLLGTVPRSAAIALDES
jgi:hypothetical protein